VPTQPSEKKMGTSISLHQTAKSPIAKSSDSTVHTIDDSDDDYEVPNQGNQPSTKENPFEIWTS
jgi:hypothetical protein